MIDLVNPKGMVLGASFFVGAVMFLIASYLIITEVVFVNNATNFEAMIVDVRREYVPMGRGSRLAYVPVVEITDATQVMVKVPVETFSEEITYKIGDKMSVLCEVSSRRCVPNTFFDKWVDSAIAYLISLVFLGIPLAIRFGSRRNHES